MPLDAALGRQIGFIASLIFPGQAALTCQPRTQLPQNPSSTHPNPDLAGTLGRDRPSPSFGHGARARWRAWHGMQQGLGLLAGRRQTNAAQRR